MWKKQLPFYLILIAVLAAVAYAAVPALDTILDNPLSAGIFGLVALLVVLGLARVMRS